MAKTKRWYNEPLYEGSRDYWMKDWVMGVLIGGSIALLFAVIIGGSLAASAYSCLVAGDNMNRDTNYVFPMGSCYVQLDDGNYVPLSLYRVSEVQ